MIQKIKSFTLGPQIQGKQTLKTLGKKQKEQEKLTKSNSEMVKFNSVLIFQFF